MLRPYIDAHRCTPMHIGVIDADSMIVIAGNHEGLPIHDGLSMFSR